VQDGDRVVVGQFAERPVHEPVRQPEFVGGEQLERGDAGLDNGLELLEDRLVFSSDRGVESEVDDRILRFVAFALDSSRSVPSSSHRLVSPTQACQAKSMNVVVPPRAAAFEALS